MKNGDLRLEICYKEKINDVSSHYQLLDVSNCHKNDETKSDGDANEYKLNLQTDIEHLSKDFVEEIIDRLEVVIQELKGENK